MDFNLKTLTPVHIGSGDILSPYGDYIKENNSIYYLDYKKIETYLQELDNQEKIIDEFVEIIKMQAAGNMSDRYNLKSFFNNHSLLLKDFSRLEIKTKANIKNEEIYQIIKTSNRPFIPGSSIKGVIRTALLYVYFKENGYDLKQMKKGYTGQDLFGEIVRDKMKYLHISDTNPLDNSVLSIVRTERFDLKKRETTIPVIREVISAGTEMKIRIQSKAENHIDGDYSYLQKGNEQQIFSRVNQHTMDNLEKEIELMQGNTKIELQDLVDKYIRIYNEINKLNSTKEGMILRIGAGKTFFDNTIALLFTDEELQKVRDEEELGNHKPFPVSRSVILEQGKIISTLGWIKLTKI